jgi:hypothetical protein
MKKMLQFFSLVRYPFCIPVHDVNDWLFFLLWVDVLSASSFPCYATRGTLVSSCGVRGRTRKATGRKNINSKQKEQPVINIMHWNAEGVPLILKDLSSCKYVCWMQQMKKMLQFFSLVRYPFCIPVHDVNDWLFFLLWEVTLTETLSVEVGGAGP